MCTNHSNKSDLHIKVPTILLMTFYGKFCSFCEIIMPKLLSRSKHEEFESNSALQIKNPKERREKCEEKWSTGGVFLPLPLCILRALFLQPLFSCISCMVVFATIFGVLPILSLVIALVFFFFFCNFIYTEHLYKPQSVQTQINSPHFGNTVSGRQFPRCFLFSFSSTFFHFLFYFLGCQTLL